MFTAAPPLRSTFVVARLLLLAGACAAAHAQTAPPTTSAPAAAERKVLRVTADSLFLRSRADLNSTPVMRVLGGTLLEFEGKEYAYFRVIPPREVYYLVAADYVRELGDGRGIVTVSEGALRVRVASLEVPQDPNTADVLARLADGTEVQILGRQDKWLRIRPPTGLYLYALDDYVTLATPAEAARFRADQAAAPKSASQPSTRPTALRTTLDEIGTAIFREASKPRESRDWAAIERRLAPIAAQQDDSEAASLARRWIELVRERAAEPAGQPTTRPAP